MSAEEGTATKRKRLRFGQACNHCRNKKHRCDGLRPTCSGCRSRDLACSYVHDDDGEVAFAHTEKNADIPSRRAKERAPPPQSSASYFGDSSSFELMSNIRQDGRVSRASPLCLAPSKANKSTSGYGTSGNGSALQVADGATTLPTKDLANRLVDAYFERVHVHYPFLHEGSFRARFEQSWVDGEPTFSDMPWYALVNLVLAAGFEFDTFCEPDADFGQRSALFVERARRVILSDCFDIANLHLVQALLLLSHHLQGTLELEQCWNFVGLLIRKAMSIGLHVNPNETSYPRPVDRETRKRVWCGCVTIDRTLSMKLGRPSSIHRADALAVDLPLEVDDHYISDGPATPRQPVGRPSRLSFFIQTIRLSSIINDILAILYPHQRRKSEDHDIPSRTQDSTVVGNTVLLDGQLQAWWNSLPPRLRHEPDVPDDIDFQRQRKVMRIRMLSIRILLQRPVFLLLAKGQCSDDYTKCLAVASSNVCILAAQETIGLIDAFYPKGMLNSLWYNLHYIFTAVCILAVVQNMDPAIRGLLCSHDLAFLDRGVQFLRSATRQSVLAARYVALLERNKVLFVPQNSILPDGPTDGDDGLHRVDDGSVVSPSNGLHVPETARDRCEPNEQFTCQRNEYDFFGLDALDPLFTSTLPQDLFLADWATHESGIF